MKFLTEGDYSVQSGTLSLHANHDSHHYPIVIEREFLEQQYGATASGDFHEYWALVLDNRAELEDIAESKRAAEDTQPGAIINITAADKPKS